MPSLLATLGLDSKGFQAGMDAAQLQAQRAGSKISSAISGWIGPTALAMGAGMLARSSLEMANRIRSLSEQFQISTDEAQRWDVAALHLNLTAEQMGAVFIRLKKAHEEALSGKATQKFISDWAQFGVTIDMLKNKSTSMAQIMDQLFKSTQGRQLSDEEDTKLYDLMGVRGVKILAAFQELKNLGPIQLFSKEDIANLSEAERNIASLKRTLTLWGGKAISWVAEAGGLLGSGFTNDNLPAHTPPPNRRELAARYAKMHANDKGEFTSVNPMLDPFGRMSPEFIFGKKTAPWHPESPDQNLGELDTSRVSGSSVRRELNLNAQQRKGAYAQAPPGFQQMVDQIKKAGHHLEQIDKNTAPKTNRGPKFG